MVFYITFIDFSAYFAIGVAKKIKGQIEALERDLGEIYYTTWSYPMAYLMSKDGIVEKEIAATRKAYTEVLIDWLQKYGVTKTYIRYSTSNIWFIELLKFQKEHQIKTVVELTSFPYDGEMEDGIPKTEDMCYREYVPKYVDRIATYSVHKEIWGIPCINLHNGISVKEISIGTKKKKENEIVMIAVSSMHIWHGYERILEGMHLYYKEGGKYELLLKLIGSGPEEQKYKELVKEYKLETHVEFLGRIEAWESEKLNEQYNLSDIAIASLGMYKADCEEGSPIKGSEYCAKGMPFVCGYRDLRFPNEWPYIMNVPNDQTPIDINKMIDFYEKVTSNTKYKELMRNYVEEHLSWNSIMEPVGDYLRK